MNTIFTITQKSGTDDATEYTINLGCDILNGKTDNDIRKMAASSATITVQSPLRLINKKTGECNLPNADAIQTHLRKSYPNASVTDGVVKTKSPAAIVKELVAKYGIDTAREMLEFAKTQTVPAVNVDTDTDEITDDENLL